MLRIGTDENPWGGLFDAADGFDKPGTFSALDNFIPNHKSYSLVRRPGFSKLIDKPTTSNGGLGSHTGSLGGKP